jgi:uncharacterized protein YifN (PemK superfamily)
MNDDAHPPLPDDAVLEAAGWVRRSRRDRLIQSTPRIGQCFWVDFPHDAYAPEFVDEHPCVVVRAARRLHDTCIIVPLTSRPQAAEKHVHKLSKNPNPVGHSQEIVAFAICDHLYTVNLARLRPIKDKTGRPIYPKVEDGDLAAIFGAIRAVLPHIFSPPAADESSEVIVTAERADSPRPRGPNTLSLKPRDDRERG